jgi:hypothetical protein
VDKNVDGRLIVLLEAVGKIGHVIPPLRNNYEVVSYYVFKIVSKLIIGLKCVLKV